MHDGNFRNNQFGNSSWVGGSLATVSNAPHSIDLLSQNSVTHTEAPPVYIRRVRAEPAPAAPAVEGYTYDANSGWYFFKPPPNLFFPSSFSRIVSFAFDTLRLWLFISHISPCYF